MRRGTTTSTVAMVLVALAAASSAALGKSAPMQATAERLYASLTPEQRELAVRKYDDPARTQEMFPGGKRVGVQIKDLDEKQKEMALSLLTAFTSDYGRQKADAIAAQEGNGGLLQYYVAFFGTPGEGQTYAWRIAEHHLTIVNVEVHDGALTEFGPILLGANPPTLWDDEEDRLIDLYAAMTLAERQKASRPGKADSAKPIGDAGVSVNDLNENARKKLKAMFDQRLGFYSPEIRARVEKLVEKQGGLGSMRLAFWGTADKRCAQGGKWDFKLGGESFLCDYENTRGHIHLSMKGRLDGTPAAGGK
jgi:hypothetical protein